MPHITKRTVDALKPDLKDTDYWDDQTPGFSLRIKPSGMKSYVIRYRTRTGGQRRVTIGQHGELTPDFPEPGKEGRRPERRAESPVRCIRRGRARPRARRAPFI